MLIFIDIGVRMKNQNCRSIFTCLLWQREGALRNFTAYSFEDSGQANSLYHQEAILWQFYWI